MTEWIPVTTALPEDDNMFCVFAKWHEPWKRWTNSESMTWGEFKQCRKWDLKNSYTHWMELPPSPPEQIKE